ncbi:hypothetical protein R3P38DRAFT_3391822 [Favolaschia claudopus]|uniref:Uncharacterized protein n=1 Tax=Favolaschia claudopus TaxID=2862362 RepID=A0AAW0C9V6_9AGAR
MAVEVFNPNPVIFAPVKSTKPSSKADNIWVLDPLDIQDEAEEVDSEEPIDEHEIFDLIRSIADPEHPNTLEELRVVSAPQVKIIGNRVHVEFTPTVPHCGMSILIGLSIRVRLLRALPSRFKIDLTLKPGSHQSELAVNKQLNDKERVAAALENPALVQALEQSLANASLRAHSHGVMQARHYQEEIFQQCQKQNLIATLPTGTGKSHIALMMCKFVASVQSNAKSIFLVPKVALVAQQAQYVASQSALRVLKLYGALEIDLADRKGWMNKFESHDVFVLTPQIFLNLITHSLWAIDKVALIVFDECHHTRKNHPYNGIMREYFEIKPPQQRPRILGLTASPVNDLKDAIGSLDVLERNLDSKVVTVHHNVEELAAHTSQVSEIIEQYPSPPQTYDFPSPTLWICLDVFRTTLRHLGIGLDDIERRHATALVNLGPYCASMYVFFETGHRISQFREQKDLAEDSPIPSELVAELMQIREIFDSFDLFSVAVPVELEWCSPKVKVLVNILRSHLSQVFQGIIFVDQRQTAFCLARLLPCIPGLEELRCAELVGEGGEGVEGVLKVSGQNTQETLQSFREGRLNLIVATSVAEEGLDLPTCDLVIRFDPLQHMIGYVQSRGRARSQASTFVVMVEENDSVQLARYKSFAEKDPELKAMYQSRRDVLDAEDSEMDDDVMHPGDLASRERYVVPSTNAVLSYDNAISLLGRLCALIPHDAYTPAHTPKFSGDFEGIVQLPSCMPLDAKDLRYRGPVKFSKKEAKRAVAFLAVKRLHELEVFDQYLLPVPSARKGYEENDGTSLLDLDQMPDIMQVSVKDPWTTDCSQQLWIHSVFVDNRRVAGLVTGSELHSVHLNCDQGSVYTSGAQSVQYCESRQREIMHLFTKECIWYRITGSPLELPLSLYLVPLTDIGQPDFHAMQRLLDCPRGNPDWSGINDFHYGHLMVVNTNLHGRAYTLERVRYDVSPTSKPPDDSSEAGFVSYLDYWKHKWTPKAGSKKRQPHIPESGPLLELRPLARTKSTGTYSLYPEPSHTTISTLPIDTAHILFPQDCCRWVDIPVDITRALEVLPALYHRLTDIYRVQRARLSLSLPPISEDRLIEAFTLPCALAGYNNQRLETLGDAVLQLCTTVHLFNRYPTRHEGQLTVMRKNSVCNRYLLSRAKELGLETLLTCETQATRIWRDSIQRPLLDDFLRTSRCVAREFPKRSLQDCMEAMLGASFVTAGIELSLRTGQALGLDFGGPLPWNIRYSVPKTVLVPAVFAELQETLGYPFRCGKLLLEALTHPSFDNQSTGSYERLEFLGDAVCELVVTDFLYRKFPASDSDQLAWPRTRAICAPALAFIAVKCLKLHQLVLVNNTELSKETQRLVPQLQACTGKEIVSRGWRYDPPKVLSDVFESIIGAILVDSNYNYERTAAVVEFTMRDVLEELTPCLRRDPVTELMEWAAGAGCNSSKNVVFKKKIAAQPGGQSSVTTFVHGVAVAGPIVSTSALVAKQLAAEETRLLLTDSKGSKRLACLCDCQHPGVLVEHAQNLPAVTQELRELKV